MPYACNLRGICEEDNWGTFATEAECQDECQGAEYRDLLPCILAYGDMTQVLEMAPSDRVQVVRELVGEILPLELADDILVALTERDIFILAHYPTLYHQIAAAAGVAEDSVEQQDIVDAVLLESGYVPGVTEETDEEMEGQERQRLQVLARYPALYPLLLRDYNNNLFRQQLRDAIAGVGPVTLTTFQFLRETADQDDDDITSYIILLRRAQAEPGAEELVQQLEEYYQDDEDYYDEGPDPHEIAELREEEGLDDD
jgi:hypothetical protein